MSTWALPHLLGLLLSKRKEIIEINYAKTKQRKKTKPSEKKCSFQFTIRTPASYDSINHLEKSPLQILSNFRETHILSGFLETSDTSMK